MDSFAVTQADNLCYNRVPATQADSLWYDRVAVTQAVSLYYTVAARRCEPGAFIMREF
jgi:hypothetical protein